MKTKEEISMSLTEKIRDIITELETKSVEADELQEQFELEQQKNLNNISRHFLESLHKKIESANFQVQRLSRFRDSLYKIKKFCETESIGLNLANLELDEIPSFVWDLSDLKYLDLSNNKFTNLPIGIGQLTNLIELDLSANQLSTLPVEIGQLINLNSLNLSGNKLTTLPAEIGNLVNLDVLIVHGNRLNRLPPEIGEIRNLRLLNLSSNDFTHLQMDLNRLDNLEELYLNFNRLLTLPHEIVQLKKLKILELIKNDLTFIQSTINRLENLRELNLGGNPLKSIPAEIGDLTNLEKLHLSRTQLKDLPLKLKKLQNLHYLNVRDTLLKIPLEIAEKAEEPHVILNYYFAQLVGEKKPLAEAKFIIIGQGNVGKTSLVQRIINNIFDSTQTKTEGITIERWQVDNKFKVGIQQSQISLNIWDFGGQEIMHATHQFFLTKRSLYLLVLDSRLTQEENRVEYWLKIIQSFGGESPVLIVGNKIDQHPLDIDRTGLQKKYPNIVGILETSATTGAGIEALKAAITEQVNNLPHVRDLLPETWFTVKTKLEELGRQSNFITHDKYLDLCAENEVSDETSQRTLIGFLHDLGVVLHFQDDPRLEALGILNPQWVTNGVYKILNSHALFQNKGLLTLAMLNEILNMDGYPRDKRLFIVDMMKKFELCYEMPYGYDIEPDKTFLVPDLLPKDQPDLNFNGIPAFEYAYPVLPSSVITRFIVRMNQKIDDGLVWRTGVVLKIGENKALVKADIEDRKITIAIDGVEHTRRDALSAIRYQLDEIHASIKGLNPEKRVPIPEAPNAEPLEYEYLLMLEREDQEIYLAKDGKRLVKVNIRELLSGIESEAQRKESAGNVTNYYIAGDVNASGDFIGRDKRISAGDRGIVVDGNSEGNLVSGDENEVN
ncbi:MAG: COR domain-containing protein [Chloroflexota bacterium]